MDNTIRVGSRVKVKDGPDEDELEIVAHEDADPAHGLISADSPMARALLGRRAGDRVKVARPEDRGAVAVLYVCTHTP
jgi:transcription elongation GreA/GreB family factor